MIFTNSLISSTDAFLLKNGAQDFYQCKNKNEQLTITTEMEKLMKRAGFKRDGEEIMKRLQNIRLHYKKIQKDKDFGRVIKWKLFETVSKLLLDDEENRPRTKIDKF